MKKRRTVYGVGINDVPNTISEYRVKYKLWQSMLRRCYCAKFKACHPTYTECTVAEEWLTFSTFLLWLESQQWRGLQLDKDVLVAGNKQYSPQTCVFVDSRTNTFLNDNAAQRGEHPLGVYWDVCRERFKVLIRNPVNLKREHLGYFDCPQQAHEHWVARKRELAHILADLQTDPRVAEALRDRFN